jgi:hypothetical protein
MKIGSVVLVIWLIIGAIAGYQRHYYASGPGNCSQAGTILVTIAAGPLNYFGMNPKLACTAPKPSQ